MSFQLIAGGNVFRELMTEVLEFNSYFETNKLSFQNFKSVQERYVCFLSPISILYGLCINTYLDCPLAVLRLAGCLRALDLDLNHNACEYSLFVLKQVGKYQHVRYLLTYIDKSLFKSVIESRLLSQPY